MEIDTKKRVRRGRYLYLIVGLLIIGVVGNYMWSGMEWSEFKEEKSIASETVQELNIDSSSTNIEIVPTNGEDIEVLAQGKINKSALKKSALTVSQKGDKLDISFATDRNRIGISFMNTYNLTIKVKLPEKLFKSVTVQSSSGNIEVSKVVSEKIAIETTSGNQSLNELTAQSTMTSKTSSGNIKANDIQAETLDIMATSGNIEVEQLGCNDVILKASSGNIKFNDDRLESNFDITTTSGNTELNFQENPDSASLDFKGTSGNLEVLIDGMLFEEKTEKMALGIVGDGENEITVRTSSGNFSLR